MINMTIQISSQQETTIDYPGKMAIIVFTPGCNFRCGFCHNPELVLEKAGVIDLDILLKNISSRTKAGWYTGICISGGEPTLQTGLVDFCMRLKEIGLSVKLDTNGSNPTILKELIDKKLVDYIAMDIKGIPERYSEIAGVKVNMENIDKSIEIVREFPFHEFRTTVLPSFNEEDIEEIGKWVSDNGRCKVKLFTLQQFNPKNTLDESFMKLVPKTSKELKKLALVIQKYAENVRVLA
jgi:pyruvate formate lyase activating enzyme